MSNAGSHRRETTRRAFLTSTGVAAGAAAVGATGCDVLSTNPADQGSNEGGDGGQQVKEAPMLAQRVRDEDLPPLEKRLPTNPLVVEPADRSGDYGGEWQGVLFGSTEDTWLARMLGYDGLVRWHADEPTGVPQPVPNLAEDVEPNDDGSEYVVTLRRGVRWSDGTPFTADDVVFAQNEVLNNTELYPAPPVAATAEQVDEHTVRLALDSPDGLFVRRQAGPAFHHLVTKPRHYLQQLMPDQNPDVEQLADDAGFDDWPTWFLNQADWLQNPELPTLRAWRPTNAYGDGNRLHFERNPYYWKTDPDGRQLPYIDRVAFRIVNDPEVAVVQASDGEIDFIDRTITTLDNKPVLARSRDSGQYRFFDRLPVYENTVVISFNLAHEDPIKEEIFNNKDFRIGLSHAINRQEIIDTAFASQGEPRQVAPLRQSPYYDDELAHQHIEYDTDRANEFLDRAFPERAGDGTRLGPDGQKIAFTLEFATAFDPAWPSALELVEQYWSEVGIQVQLQPIDRSLLYERKEGNLHDANVWGGAAGWRDDILLDPRWYFPVNTESNYAIPWADWFTSDGDDGAEPPEETKRQMELYRQLVTTTDVAEQDELMTQIINIAKEQFYVIGISLVPPSYGVATNRFRNVPDTLLQAWVYQPPGISSPEQYFIEADQQ